ncbi:MAG: mechanosensitive ion channel [Chloroflexota bacterium]|nr:mechanosensitive ion channel [Chloroflexota bacterium]
MPETLQPIQDIGDAVLLAITDALRNLLGFLPQLVGALVVLILGWIISGIVAGLVERALRLVGFERAAESSGIAGFIQQSGAGSKWTASRVVAEIVKWFIRLIALQAAASILGMPQLTQIINSILLFLPNVVVALAIVVVGALIARFVGGIVRGATSEMGFGNPELMANIARYAIIVFAVIAAVNQLGIAPTVVNTLFIATVGAVAAAFALAFGLGGRDVAAQLTQSWYSKSQEAAQRVSQLAERRQADQQRVQAAEQPMPASSTVQPRPASEPQF